MSSCKQNSPTKVADLLQYISKSIAFCTEEELIDIAEILVQETKRRKKIAPQPPKDESEFRICFMPYYIKERNSDYQHVVEMLNDSQYNNKDRARMAHAIFEANLSSTKKILNDRYCDTRNFVNWYRHCCECFGWHFNKDYQPVNLTDNYVKKRIMIYL